MAEYPEQPPSESPDLMRAAVYVRPVAAGPGTLQIDSASFVVIELFQQVEGCGCGLHTEDHVDLYVGGLKVDNAPDAAHSLADLLGGLAASLAMVAAEGHGEL